MHYITRTFIVLAASTLPVLPAYSQETQKVSQEESSSSNSLMARALNKKTLGLQEKNAHALRDVSMFAVAPPKPREFEKHDLVQIVVRETSNAKSSQTLETEKEYSIKGRIAQWPDFNLVELLQLQLMQGSGDNKPQLDLSVDKDFEGDGEYERKDDFTARLTAEVIDILPNGNLVLEARTFIKTDQETQTIKVTGICRPEDVSAANTIFSSQLHDLNVEKNHEGELRKSSEKGIIAQILDTIFAF